MLIFSNAVVDAFIELLFQVEEVVIGLREGYGRHNVKCFKLEGEQFCELNLQENCFVV
jgi:hypothetical protein